MLTNLHLFAINGDITEFATLAEHMEDAQFVACTPTQAHALGWVAPRSAEGGGAMLENVGGQWIASLMLETRSVPSPVVKRALKTKADEVEKATGRRPKGKALKLLKEEVVHALMPRAFSKQVTIPVWVDPTAKLVGISASGATKAEAAALALAECSPKMNLHALQTKVSAEAAMTMWVRESEAPAGFTIGSELELRGDGENPPVVTYAGLDLETEDAAARVDSGMRAHKLAMSYDDRAYFTLNGNGTIKGIQLLNVELADKGDVDAFDADVALQTGTLAPMLAALIAGLGGVMELPIEQESKREEPAGDSA